MAAKKLTVKQKEVFKLLTDTPGGIIRQHIKPTGTVCYRILDSKFNPITNVNRRTVDELASKEVIEREGANYIIHATI